MDSKSLGASSWHLDRSRQWHLAQEPHVVLGEFSALRRFEFSDAPNHYDKII